LKKDENIISSQVSDWFLVGIYICDWYDAKVFVFTISRVKAM